MSSCLPACLVSVVRPPFDFYIYIRTGGQRHTTCDSPKYLASFDYIFPRATNDSVRRPGLACGSAGGAGGAARSGRVPSEPHLLTRARGIWRAHHGYPTLPLSAYHVCDPSGWHGSQIRRHIRTGGAAHGDDDGVRAAGSDALQGAGKSRARAQAHTHTVLPIYVPTRRFARIAGSRSPTHPLFPICRTPFPPYVRN